MNDKTQDSRGSSFFSLNSNKLIEFHDQFRKFPINIVPLGLSQIRSLSTSNPQLITHHSELCRRRRPLLISCVTFIAPLSPTPSPSPAPRQPTIFPSLISTASQQRGPAGRPMNVLVDNNKLP